MIEERTPLHAIVTTSRDDRDLALERGLAAVERANALNGDLHAFIEVADPTSLAPPPAGSLSGVSVSVKDNINVAGFTTTCGSAFIRLRPEADPPIVARMRAAAASIIGKTNLGECALDATSNNPTFGAVANPFGHDRTPGGSSGGGAAAIAAGIGDIAIGTDSGGSVRIPAAFCGIASYRPTGGAWSLEGIESPAWSVDSYGVMGRTVEDLAYFVGALAIPGTSLPQGSGGSVGQVRVGYLRDDSMGPSQPGVWAQYDAAIECLKEAGYQCRPVTLSGLEQAPYACAVIAYSEIASAHREMIVDDPMKYGSAIRPLLYLGDGFSAQDYLTAQAARPILGSRFSAVADAFDVVLTPTMPMTAPRVGEEPSIPGDNGELALFSYIRFTCLANLIDVPTISIPIGSADDGMPVGLQLIGRRHSDGELLDVGIGVENAVERSGLGGFRQAPMMIGG